MFTIKQDQMIWSAALLAFKILRDVGRLANAGSVLLVCEAINDDAKAFPPALLAQAEDAVADRLELIRARAHLGQQLCPELSH